MLLEEHSMKALEVTFDGEVFRPDEVPDLEANRRYVIRVEEPETGRTEVGEAVGKNARAIALLRTWQEAGANADSEEIRKAEEEVAALKRRLNANRRATGERLVFPE
jgi:hypothetical protein